MKNPIQVTVSYHDENLSKLISVFESNLDLDEVNISKERYSVKAIIPISFIIIATSTYLLEKFILSPLIDPIAEKFNWVNAIEKYLKPIQPFYLTITITDENLIIDAPLGFDQETTKNIWLILEKVLGILRKENKINDFTKISISPNKTNTLSIICYQDNKPVYFIDLKKSILLKIPNEE